MKKDQPVELEPDEVESHPLEGLWYFVGGMSIFYVLIWMQAVSVYIIK